MKQSTPWYLLSAFLLVLSGSAAAQQAPGLVHVTAAATLPGPVSGRLLLFMRQGSGDATVDNQEFHPGTGSKQTWIAAQEIHDLAPGASVEVDANLLAYPSPFGARPQGTWEMQAVLDVDHTYNYSGRAASDWESAVTMLPGAGEPTLTLSRHPKSHDTALPAYDHSSVEPFAVQSGLLSRFWGRSTSIRAWVVLPPGYDPHGATRYPTAFWTHGFGGNLAYSLRTGLMLRKRMEQHEMPPMFWVMLDESVAQGTHEFADSANNGPWGAALTTEFLPALEAKYHMDARPSGRLLNGHSSGGWATLQLEVNYPQIFGGTWSTSPDPSDFHDFTGTDLYAPHANVYHSATGTATPLMRADGKVVATFEQLVKTEAVLGPYGGQIASFEWVFSPKGDSGAPEQMFDRVTGEVHAEVVRYWHDHYDLAHLLEQEWPARGPLLAGRIHLFVGTADTFYLDGSAHLLDARLKKLNAGAQFHYLPGRTHFDLYKAGEDRNGLFDQIGREMYAVARPGTK